MKLLSLLCIMPVALGLVSSNRLLKRDKSLRSLTTVVDYDASEVAQLVTRIDMLEEALAQQKVSPGSFLSNESISTEDAQLIKDIELLSSFLGEVIKRENKDAYEIFEKFRNQALSRSAGDRQALGRMVAGAVKISPEDALIVVRAFSEMLNLINAAEVSFYLSSHLP